MSIPLSFNFDNINIGHTILNDISLINIDSNINITPNSYISFGKNYGIDSYGFRDNNGVI